MNRAVYGLLFMLLWKSLPAQNAGIAVGRDAPRFSLPFATRDSVFRSPLSVSELLGRSNIVLAFYPADWSSGCTKEVCMFRDNFSLLQTLDVEILAISGDYVWSHHAWARHHDLPFKLLSDHDHSVARMYESFNEATGYNKRTVFVIDKAGKIAYADFEYRVNDMKDFQELRDALQQLP